jgi:hypothetical protein
MRCTKTRSRESAAWRSVAAAPIHLPLVAVYSKDSGERLSSFRPRRLLRHKAKWVGAVSGMKLRFDNNELRRPDL